MGLSFMKSTRLYKALKTLPKGVLHNVFFDCCEDIDFVSLSLTLVQRKRGQ